ncbi:MAG: hypothetical protein ABI349_10590 [Casimicrobiaceae bacterium]
MTAPELLTVAGLRFMHDDELHGPVGARVDLLDLLDPLDLEGVELADAGLVKVSAKINPANVQRGLRFAIVHWSDKQGLKRGAAAVALLFLLRSGSARRFCVYVA